MIDVQIHPMRASHISEVLGIERAVFSTPWTENMFVQEVSGVLGSRPHVVVTGNRVIGYEIAWFFEEEVHLVNIAVERAFRRKGIGRMLLSHLIEQAMAGGKQSITLEVRESNRSAQEFYRRFHFRTVGIRKGYYSDVREDALLMTLDLKWLTNQKSADGGRFQTG